MPSFSKPELVAGILILLTCACAAAAPVVQLPERSGLTPINISNWVSSIINPTHSRLLLPATRKDTQWPQVSQAQSYQALQSVAAGGLDELTQRAENLEQAWRSETGESQSFVLLPAQLQGLFLPAVVGYAVAIEREETSRRFALTALAIKRFQLQTGHWPENLSQLERVGLDPSDRETVSGGRFGYEATDGRAYLWSYERHKESGVSSTHPPLQLEDGTSNTVVTTIH